MAKIKNNLNNQKSVVVITNIPNPYRIPLFNELNSQLTDIGIGFSVIFGAISYKRRKFKLNLNDSEFNYLCLKSAKFNLGNSEKTIFTYKELFAVLRKLQPEKIIIIGFSIGTLKLWIRSFWNKTPIIIWSGSILGKTKNYSHLKTIFRKIISKRISGFIAYGTQAKKYLESLGIDEKKIKIAINTVDTDFFFTETIKIRKMIHKSSRKKFLTYIGYLVPRKGVKQLLDIISILKKERKDFILEIIGDGSDRKSLEEYVIKKNISRYVNFIGFKQKDELPKYLARSNCFLFQTNFDIWGLVLNEAMAAGVPCISSINAGATFDLIVEGKTGFAINFEDTEQVVERINWILNNAKKAEVIGKSASDYIKDNANIKKSVEGFMDLIKINQSNRIE